MTAAADVWVLYDSGRLPPWLRIPCLLVAVFCLGLTIDRSWLRLFGRTLLLPVFPETPLGWIPAVAATALLAVFFAQLSVGRKRILWNSTSRQLIVEDRWLFGTARSCRAQADLVSVWLRFGRVLAGTHWNVYVRDSCGVAHWLTQLQAEPDARAVAERIAAAIERPLEVT